MANPFTITITAVVKATATVRKVNQSMARLTSPVRDLKQSFGSLGRELGIDKVSASFGKVASSARGAVSAVSSLAPALGALAGVATVAGIASLATNWGKLGAEISKSSAVLGVSTSELQAYQAAARLAGGSAEDMTGALKSLGDTLEDASFNRNNQALILMNQLGITMTKTKSGAVDATRALRQVAEAISKQNGNVQAQRLIARTFGVEQLLPMLQKGAAGIEAYVAQARSLGSVMSPAQIAAANEYAQNMTKLDIAVDGLKQSIGNALVPVLSPLLEQLSQWVTQNRELIATNVADFVKSIATWVKSVDWKKVGDDVGGFVDAIGGVKGVAIGLAAITFAGPIAGVLSLIASLTKLATVAAPAAASALGSVGSTGLIGKLGIAGLLSWGGLKAAKAAGLPDTDSDKGRDAVMAGDWLGASTRLPAGDFLGALWGKATGKSNAEIAASIGGAPGTADAMAYFQGKGWTKEQASGIVSNLHAESGLRTNAEGDNGKAYGLAQWHPDRQAAFAKWAGKDIRKSSLEEQLGFVHHELTEGAERRAGQRLRAAGSAAEAGEIVSRLYERPAKADEEAAKRAATATQLAGSAPMSSVYSGAPGGRAAGTSGGGAQGGGKVLVEVVLSGATQGVKASSKASGNVEATTRVREPMLTENVV